MSRQGPSTRRGSTYLTVLLTSAIVGLIGMAALSTEHFRTLIDARQADWLRARALAVSAVEHGLHFVAEQSVSPGWRAIVESADEDVSPVLDLGGGTIQWALKNHRGDRMSGDPNHPIYVTGTGVFGAASHTLEVVVRPAGPSFSGLTAAVAIDRDIDLTASAVVVQCDGRVVSNASMDAFGGGLFATAFEAVGEIAGGSYYGVTLPSSPPQGIPSDPFEYYETYGTPIDAEDLPLVGGARRLADVLLTPNANPFGGGVTNAEGIYVLDLHGDDLVIKRTRVLGTLLVRGLGPGAIVEVDGSVLFEPAMTHYPPLLVDGDLRLSSTDTPLSESDAGVNFNPPGSPFAGFEDEVLDDDYPSLIRGLVYADGDVIIAGDYTTIEGLLLADGKLKSEPGGSGAVLEVNYDSAIAEDPPPGFFVPDGTVRVAAFSWSQAE